MAKPTPWKDEYTLLCEKCGYVIEGLDPAGPCPECGKPIEESLPERRVGTPWQQEPGAKSLVRTWWMTLRHPKRTLDVMRFSKSDGVMHSFATLISTFILGVSIASLPYIFDEIYTFLGILMLGVGIGMATLIFCLVLTGIEARGLRFLGKNKSFRVDHSIAWAVVGHGTVGWLIAGIGLGIGACLFMYYPSRPSGPPFEAWIDNARILNKFSGWTIISSALIGFLFFEFFAYLGLRRCKYANRIRPQEQADG